jgi:putative transposase
LKRITKPILGFKSFNAAKNVLAGIELIRMIRKGLLNFTGSEVLSFPDQIYALTGEFRSG